MIPSPLEYLKAFAICFAIGAAAVVAGETYGRLIRQQRRRLPY